MKKYLFALVAGLIPALATTTQAYAQNVNKNFPFENELAVVSSNKPSGETGAATATVELAGINTKAIKSFTKNYAGATKPDWSTTVDGFRAKFTGNGITQLVYYNKRGNWLGSLKNYSEAQLNKNVRDIIKRVYYDFNIILVQEIETTDSHGTPTYIVHIEDADNYKMLIISDGDMQVHEEFKKQK